MLHRFHYVCLSSNFFDGDSMGRGLGGVYDVGNELFCLGHYIGKRGVLCGLVVGNCC
jgi:hypothetical protein